MIADEPTAFANTPTAAVVAPGRAVVALGVGWPGLKFGEVGALGLQLGLGGGVELAAALGVSHSAPVYPAFQERTAPAYTLGAKRALGTVGGWDAAAAIAGTWAGGGAFGASAYAALPFTREAGAWQWTLGPRAYFPDLTGGQPLNGCTVGLLAGGLWRFHDAWALWGELHPAWFQGGYPVLGPGVGLRGRLWPGGWLEAGAQLDVFHAGHYPVAPERNGFLAATVKQAF